MNPPTVAQSLAAAQTLGLDRLDAQLLLLHALGRSGDERAWLLAHDTDTLPADTASAFTALALRRLAGEPVAYLVGHKEFFGLDFAVDARVLVPRPDTETLVHWSLEVLGALPESVQLAVLDLGTGSGAVALAIADSLPSAGPRARITATDASPGPLDVAAANAQRLGVEVDFLQSHWLREVGGHFHLIASNPPYIAAEDPHLAALKHEPLSALAAGADGLDDLREIIDQAPQHLLAGGWLLLEHGYDQAAAVRALLGERGFVQVQSRCDLAGIERCSGGQWVGPSTA